MGDDLMEMMTINGKATFYRKMMEAVELDLWLLRCRCCCCTCSCCIEALLNLIAQGLRLSLGALGLQLRANLQFDF